MRPRDDRPEPALPPRLDPRAGRTRSGARSGTRSDTRSGGTGSGGRRRGVTAVRALCGLVSLALLAGAGWGWDLERVADASVNRSDAIPTSGNTDASGGEHARAEMNLLVVGMDSRQGLTAQQQEELSTGDPDGLHNTDSMMLVHVPADGSAASFVSLARDMYVSIPGHGMGKLNSAYASSYAEAQGSEVDKDVAGSQLLIQTVSSITGLQIDHFAEVNLLGFFNLSNIVGGVTVNLCQATSDPLSGAHFKAGVQTISGADALKFVRQRHHIGTTSTDFDRQRRQQVFIAGLLRNVLSSKLLLSPARQKQVVTQVGGSVTVDENLNLLDLASQMQGVQPGNITFQTVPGLTDSPNGLTLPSKQYLRDFFADLTADHAGGTAAAAPTTSAAPRTVAPGQVTVSVVNGSGVTGAAGTAATALARAGFVAATGGNAARTATTTIRHRTGDDATAATLAAQVPGATLTADDTLAAGHVTLTLGTDFTAVGQQITAAPTGTAAPPSIPGSYANEERTAADTSCIN